MTSEITEVKQFQIKENQWIDKGSFIIKYDVELKTGCWTKEEANNKGKQILQSLQDYQLVKDTTNLERQRSYELSEENKKLKADIRMIIDPEFLDESQKITAEYDRKKGVFSTNDKLLHIVVEVGELANSVRDHLDFDRITEELADVFLTTIALKDNMGISNLEFDSAITKKLIKVKKRIDQL